VTKFGEETWDLGRFENIGVPKVGGCEASRRFAVSLTTDEPRSRGGYGRWGKVAVDVPF
jgi:hypothetical protein